MSGHGWTLKKLRQWVSTTYVRQVGRNAIHRALHSARLSWKRMNNLLRKAKPQKRVEHVERLARLFEQVHRHEVTLISFDESHFHQDQDHGSTWGPKGQRSWRVSTTPGLAERLTWYGAYDFTHGLCLIWEDGPCDISLKALREACLAFVAELDGDDIAVVDRFWPKLDLGPEREAKLLVST